MTADFRKLCAELLQALTTTNPSAFGQFAALEDRARAALAEPQPPTFRDAIRLAKGSHDYSGGYGSTPCAEAFHAGIDTVVNVLTKAATGPWDYQTKAVFQAAEPQPPAAGEVAELVADLKCAASGYFNRGFSTDARRCRRAAELLERLAPLQPIPVSERPKAKDCDSEGNCWRWNSIAAGWHREPIGRCWYEFETHWLPAHALPVPEDQP